MSSTHALCLQVRTSDSGDAMEGNTDEFSVCVNYFWYLVFGFIAPTFGSKMKHIAIVHAQQYRVRKIWTVITQIFMSYLCIAATYCICPLLLWKWTVFHNLKLLGYGTFGLHPTTLSRVPGTLQGSQLSCVQHEEEWYQWVRRPHREGTAAWLCIVE